MILKTTDLFLVEHPRQSAGEAHICSLPSMPPGGIASTFKFSMETTIWPSAVCRWCSTIATAQSLAGKISRSYSPISMQLAIHSIPGRKGARESKHLQVPWSPDLQQSKKDFGSPLYRHFYNNSSSETLRQLYLELNSDSPAPRPHLEYAAQL